MMGRPVNGLPPAAVGPMGEMTDVASAKRAALGDFRESELDELEEVRDRTVTAGSFLSSDAWVGCRGWVSENEASALV